MEAVDTGISLSISRDDVLGFATKERRLSLLEGKEGDDARDGEIGEAGLFSRSKRGENSCDIVWFATATRDGYRKERTEKKNGTRKSERWFDCALLSPSEHATRLSFVV